MTKFGSSSLVATPIYRGSYSGALKNFFDLVPNDPKGHDPLRARVVWLLATGGSDHHYLILEHQLRPLFGFFGAYTPARAIYAVPKDFDAQKQAQGKLIEELTQLGQLLRYPEGGWTKLINYEHDGR